MINLSYHIRLLLSNEIEFERSIRMYELSVFQQGGVDVIDSRSVAEAIEKPHSDLMKSIRNYAEFLNAGDFSSVDFFIPSTYTDTKGEERPCYLLTKKGCDMVANKMTGEKGVLFTAAYVTAFENLRQQTQKPMTTNEMFAMQAQINLESERKLAALEGKVDETNRKFDAVTTFVTSPLTDADTWQERMTRHIRRAVEEFGLNYQQFHAKLYEELERTAGVDLKCRQTRMRNRMYAAGATKTECRAVSKLAVIAADKKLRAMFETILRNEIVRLATSRSVAI